MKFSTVVTSLLVAVVSVTGQSTTDSSTMVTSGTALSPAQASEAACLKNCAANDATCRTNCVLVGVRVNPIADCQATCVHGNGTSADNIAYENCMAGCISTAGVQPTAITTGSAPSTTVAMVTSTAAGAVNTGSATGTSAPMTTAKTNASDRLQLGAAVGGMLGLLAVMVVL